MNNDMMCSRGEQKNTKEDFKPGDSVWLEVTNIHSNQLSWKLDNKRYGPFEVEEKVSNQAYCLKFPETWAIHNIFHLTLLTRTHAVEFDSQKKLTPPPPDIIEEEKDMRLKKSADIEGKEEEPNTWYTGKVMETRMTHGYPGLPWEMQKNYYPNI
jgi:hypothetical protein